MAWTNPKQWNVGDALTSADLNTYVRDNLNYLLGGTSWTPATLNSGWSQYGSGWLPLGYMRQGTSVLIQGIVKNTSGAQIAASSTVATGFPPAVHNDIFSAGAELNGVHARIDFGWSNGAVITLVAVPANNFIIVSSAYNTV